MLRAHHNLIVNADSNNTKRIKELLWVLHFVNDKIILQKTGQLKTFTLLLPAQLGTWRKELRKSISTLNYSMNKQLESLNPSWSCRVVTFASIQVKAPLDILHVLFIVNMIPFNTGFHWDGARVKDSRLFSPLFFFSWRNYMLNEVWINYYLLFYYNVIFTK